ncbi:MAG: hypothetical protein PHE83_02705 [Opitutaceae bacterium]|nr:hypothetical protein [Opitutaceae bacterium]
MGLLDRLLPKKSAGPAPAAIPPPAAPVARPAGIQPENPAPALPPPSAGGGVLTRLRQAREALEHKDLAGALAVYEEVLASAGDRADVLVTISGDLGVTGHPREIIGLVAPRYDAQRHGPATGLNVLQAYLAVREPQSAQHVLDLLFALDRPDLEERLLGFSNAIADMMLLEAEGVGPPAPPAGNTPEGEATSIELVSISKPIWFYGLESMPDLLPPKAGKLRRIAFGQLSVLGLKDFAGAARQPENELGRLSRGIPLWLAEMLFFSANSSTLAVIGTRQREHYGLFPVEWTTEHIRQLIETVEGGLDFVCTGALRQEHGDYELVLHLWEVKKFRERKSFLARWTPATADQALAQLQAQLRAFMEFTPHPAGQGLVYTPPAKLQAYIEALGAGLTLFLGEKQILPPAQLVIPAEVAGRAAALAAESELATLLALSLQARARRLGLAALPAPAALAATPAVAQARQVLAL